MLRSCLFSSAFLAFLLMLAAAAPVAAQSHVTADSGTFTVLHGRDTVATEYFRRSETELRGTLVLAGAAHGAQEYMMVVAPDATVPLVEVTVREYGDTGKAQGRIVQRARVIFKEDSAAVDALTDHGIETRLFGTERGAIPYLNLSFALLEQAVRRVRALGTSHAVEVPFFNLGGGQTAAGRFTPAAAADSLVLTIGNVEFRLRTDDTGRILGARIPAQDVVVERR